MFQSLRVSGFQSCFSTSQTLLKEGFKSPLGDLGVKHNLASKTKHGARHKFLAPRSYNLMFLLFHFFCLTKRNETILRLSENKRKFIFDLLNVSKIKN